MRIKRPITSNNLVWQSQFPSPSTRNHGPFSPPVVDVVDQNVLGLCVRRTNHLCVVAHGHEAHAQCLCWHVVLCAPVELKDVRSITQSQTRVLVTLSLL